MEIIDNIAFRVKDPRMLRMHYAPYILRSMNRVYQRINRETKCLEKLLEIAAGTFSDTVDYVDLPSDMMEIFQIEPVRIFKPPEKFVFTDEEFSQIEYTYTITRGRIYFSGVDATSYFNILYYSSGLTLVDKADEDLGEDEVQRSEAAQPLKVFQSGVGDPGKRQIQPFELFKPLEVFQPGVGDLGAAEVELLQVG